MLLLGDDKNRMRELPFVIDLVDGTMAIEMWSDTVIETIEDYEAFMIEILGIFPEGTVRHVNAYLTTRHYGGPEEGGWWYNHYEFIGGIVVDNQKDEYAAHKRLEELYDDRASGNIYSVSGGCQVDIWTALEPGKSHQDANGYE